MSDSQDSFMRSMIGDSVSNALASKPSNFDDSLKEALGVTKLYQADKKEYRPEVDQDGYEMARSDYVQFVPTDPS